MALVADPFTPSTIYAATLLEGVYRSLDGGASWSPANLGLGSLDTTGVAADPAQSGRLLVTTMGGLYQSRDGADSWTRVASLAETYLDDPVISPAAPLEIYVGGRGPFRSLDGGVTWTRIADGLVPQEALYVTLAASSTAPLRLFAGTSRGLFRSDDHGDSWNRIDLGALNGNYVPLIAVDPGNGNRVMVNVAGKLLVSLDGGATFTAAVGINSEEVSAVVFDPANPSLVFCVSFFGGVLRSQDGGGHWSPFRTGFPLTFEQSPVYVRPLLLAERPTRHLLAGTGLGPFSRPLSDGRWVPSRRGMMAVEVREVMQDPSTPASLYIAGDFGLYRSLDSGGDWDVVLNEGINRLASDGTTPDLWYAGGHAMFRSQDGGDSWIRQTSGLAIGLFGALLDVGGLVIDPESPSHILIGGDHLVLDTDNGGDYWRRLSIIPGYVNDLAIDPDSSQTIYAATAQGVFKSEDGGASWRLLERGLPMTTTGRLLAVETDPRDPSLVYLGSSNGGVFRSLDKGETWMEVNRGLTGRQVGTILIDPLVKSTIYVGTEAGVERSVDGGESWSLLTTKGLVGTAVASLAIDAGGHPGSPQALLAGTRRAGVFKLQLPNTGTFAQFGDGSTDDHIFTSQLILLNTDERPSNATLLLHDKRGAAFSVGIDGVESAGRLDLSLPGRSMRVLRTDGEGPLRAGWAALHSDQPMEGVVVFESDAGAAGVGRSPVSDAFEVPVQTSAARRLDTGLALANPLATPNHIQLQLLDRNHGFLAEAEITLPALGQSALFVDQIAWQAASGPVDFSDFLGLVTARAQAPVAATAIQTEPGEFATFPVIVLDDDQGSDGSIPTTLHFPQFANGVADQQRIVSTLLLVNRSLVAPARAAIEFRDQDGLDLGPRLFPGAGPAIELEIPPGAIRTLETDGLGAVVSGSATVVSDHSLAGVLIYSGESGAAGVAASPSFSDGWAAPVQTDLSDRLDTGVAVMNLEDHPALLHATLRDAAGLALAETFMDLPGRGQRALFVDQLDWTWLGEPLDFSRFDGWIEANSSSPSTATVIRTRPSQFAVFPVVPLQ